jgi:hypothetical protein
MDSGIILTFIIVSICLALILIMKRDSIHPPFRRPLAILALIMVVASFVLILYSAFHLGS